MERKENLKLVRIFIGESDKYKHNALYEEIVFLAKRSDLAGATVTRGIMGFGAHSVVHKSKIIELSNDLPVIIEIVDADDKIRKFITEVENLFEESKNGGLITIEEAEVILYKPGVKKEE
jgi:PII-like signaling protein